MIDFSGTLNIEDADAFYARLIDLIESVPEDQREQAMARLVLLLANAVGDRQILDAALETARRSFEAGGASS